MRIYILAQLLFAALLNTTLFTEFFSNIHLLLLGNTLSCIHFFNISAKPYVFVLMCMAKGIYLLIVFFLHAVRIITICIRAYHNHGLSCIFFYASSDFLLYLRLQKIHLCPM